MAAGRWLQTGRQGLATGWVALALASACSSDAPGGLAPDQAGDSRADAAPIDRTGSLDCGPGWLAAAAAQGKVCAPDWPVWGALPVSPAAPASHANRDDTYVAPDTGRMWRVRADAELLTWPAARAACAQEQAGGHRDWHLPTLAELQAVVDYQRGQPASQLPLKTVTWYWSASPATDPGRAWGVAMASGLAATATAETAGIALCVRAVDGPGAAGDAPRFQVDGSGEVVQDHLTGLTWQRHGNTSGLQPYDYAQVHCQKLSLQGGGWRTPTVVELASLVDRRRAQPAADADALPGTKAAPYWTSTPYAGVALYAWYVEFSTGSVRFDGDRTYTFAWVRWVR
ncbi:MAG: DUF1566 domain-containing protein [Deltaproteobacteria bacterium]|nr:DUF1566 domain-containing protein [Deltaproteobacteria bacterium]